MTLMTDRKEVIAYIIAHVAGYVASSVISQAVLVPLLIQANMQAAWWGAFLVLNVLVQTAVFFGFIAIRGRRVPREL